MTTTVEIDEPLLQDAMRISGDSSSSKTVEAALRLMIQLRAQEAIFELQGKVEFWPDYDYKAMRTSRFVDLHA